MVFNRGSERLFLRLKKSLEKRNGLAGETATLSK